MARRKVNKSAKIREAFDTLGHDSKPKVVQDALAKKGIKVSYGIVAAVKSRLNGNSNGKAGGSIALNDLLEAKKLVNKLGSIQAAKEAVDTLAKLM